MSDAPVRFAVVGAGSFGQNHLRVIAESPRAALTAVVDIDANQARQAETRYGCQAHTDWRAIVGKVDAAVVATPTATHAGTGCALLEAGIHVLVEKPIAPSMADAEKLCRSAEQAGRLLQVGHLERFNPAVLALMPMIRLPLFFEIHRMSVFAPRSLDVDVVLDLMIHDLDIVLSMVRSMPEEVRAAGIRILSDKVDIANVRLAFPGGCIANLSASRASTEKVRKLRLFQPHQYISIDYARQDGVAITVGEGAQIGFQPLQIQKREPLAAQLDSFLDAIAQGRQPLVSGREASKTLQLALEIAVKIEQHGQVVQKTLTSWEERTS